MDQKNRTVFALLIAVVIAVAVLSSFGLNFLGGTPRVSLPELSDPGSVAPTPSGGAPLGDYVKVAVTADTVQSVIVTLSRPESYSRTVTVETFGTGDAVGKTTSTVVVDGGWTKVDTVLTGGQVEHSLVGEGQDYVFYDRSPGFKAYDAKKGAADLAQRIPTYEDVLALEQDAIKDTGYELRGEIPCIYVETYVAELEQYERFWVSVSTGLLVSSETVKGEKVVYRMTASEVVVPATPGTVFALPDGTVLHTVGG